MTLQDRLPKGLRLPGSPLKRQRAVDHAPSGICTRSVTMPCFCWNSIRAMPVCRMRFGRRVKLTSHGLSDLRCIGTLRKSISDTISRNCDSATTVPLEQKRSLTLVSHLVQILGIQLFQLFGVDRCLTIILRKCGQN